MTKQTKAWDDRWTPTWNQVECAAWLHGVGYGFDFSVFPRYDEPCLTYWYGEAPSPKHQGYTPDGKSVAPLMRELDVPGLISLMSDSKTSAAFWPDKFYRPDHWIDKVIDLFYPETIDTLNKAVLEHDRAIVNLLIEIHFIFPYKHDGIGSLSLCSWRQMAYQYGFQSPPVSLWSKDIANMLAHADPLFINMMSTAEYSMIPKVYIGGITSLMCQVSQFPPAYQNMLLRFICDWYSDLVQCRRQSDGLVSNQEVLCDLFENSLSIRPRLLHDISIGMPVDIISENERLGDYGQLWETTITRLSDESYFKRHICACPINYRPVDHC
jgi:hypothetical protein